MIGRFTLVDLQYAAVLVLGVILGIAVSGSVKKVVDRQTARPYLLGLCFISASLVIGRALVV